MGVAVGTSGPAGTNMITGLYTAQADLVEQALDMLLAAERPLILARGGVILAEASDVLREVADTLDVPVQVTLMGMGSFPEDHRAGGSGQGRPP